MFLVSFNCLSLLAELSLVSHVATHKCIWKIKYLGNGERCAIFIALRFFRSVWLRVVHCGGKEIKKEEFFVLVGAAAVGKVHKLCLAVASIVPRDKEPFRAF